MIGTEWNRSLDFGNFNLQILQGDICTQTVNINQTNAVKQREPKEIAEQNTWLSERLLYLHLTEYFSTLLFILKDQWEEFLLNRRLIF